MALYKLSPGDPFSFFSNSDNKILSHVEFWMLTESIYERILNKIPEIVNLFYAYILRWQDSNILYPECDIK